MAKVELEQVTIAGAPGCDQGKHPFARVSTRAFENHVRESYTVLACKVSNLVSCLIYVLFNQRTILSLVVLAWMMWRDEVLS